MNLLILHVKKSSIVVLMSMNATQMDCECLSETFQQSDSPKKWNTYHNDLEPPPLPQVSLLCAAFGGISLSCSD